MLRAIFRTIYWEIVVNLKKLWSNAYWAKDE